VAGGRRGKDDRKKYIDSVAREDGSGIQFITVAILEICRLNLASAVFFMGKRVRDVQRICKLLVYILHKHPSICCSLWIYPSASGI
jgi:hypothetical protein